MHRLVCLGLSHRTAPVELRERLGALGAGVERCPAVTEHAVLQTCYRVELYARLTSGVEDARDELVDVLAYAHEVPRELLVDHLYVHAGEDVARHLCRVAAGLDSLVLGEAEILGQVGDAFAAAQSQGSVGPGLELLFRTAISAGRRARSETAHRREPGDGELDGARPRRRRARRSARAAPPRRRCGPDRPADARRGGESRASRTSPLRTAQDERAVEAAERCGARALPLSELEDALVDADVVVAATSSEAAVLSAHAIAAAMDRRPTPSARRRRPGRARGRRTRGG